MKGCWKRGLRISWYLLGPLLFYAVLHDAVWLVCDAVYAPIPATTAAAAVSSAGLAIWYRKERLECHLMRSSAGLCVILAAVVSCILLNQALFALGIAKDGYDAVKGQVFEQRMIWQLTGTGLLVPLAEELVFRGLGYQRLRRETDAWTSAVFTSVLFGLYHGNLLQGIYAGIMGLFLAFVCEHYKSLTASWLFHAAANITAIIMTAYGF